MGVDYYACNYCQGTFPDCGSYTGCHCGKHWCDDACAESEGFREEENGFTPKGSHYEQETSCNYCRDEDFPDDSLLDLALTKLNMSRQDLIIEYKKSREGV